MEHFAIDARRLHPEEREMLARMIGHITLRERIIWFMLAGITVMIGFSCGVLMGISGKEREAIRCGAAEYVNGDFRWKANQSSER